MLKDLKAGMQKAVIPAKQYFNNLLVFKKAMKCAMKKN